MDMSKLVSSIGIAVQQAQHHIEEHQAQQYLHYFDASGSENGEQEQGLAPKTCLLNLPGEGEAVQVPLLSLVHHNNMNLDQLTIKFRVDMAEMKEGIDLQTGACTKSEAEAAASGSGEVELIFRQSPAPEGIARITQCADQFI